MIGIVDAVVLEPAGSQLAQDVAIGDETITVEWAVDFAGNGGLLDLDGTVLTYVAADDTTITLAAPSPVTMTASDDTRVIALTSLGEPELDPRVDVRLDLDDDESVPTVPCEVDSPLALQLQTKLVGESDSGLLVEVQPYRGGYKVVSFVGRTGQVDGTAIWQPHALRQMDAVTISDLGDSAWTQITSWTDLEADGVSTGSGCTINYSALYRIEAQIAFEAYATGRRWLRVLLNGDATDPIGYFSVAADSSGGSTYVPVTVQRRLNELDVITVEARHTAGVGLAIVTGRNRSKLDILRVAA